MSRIENMVPYCARMPRGLLDQAKAAARAEGMGLSELVRFLLREYVRGHAAPVMQVDRIDKDNVQEVLSVLRRGGSVIGHVSDKAVPPEGVEWLMAICRAVEKAAREAAENEVNERVHKMLEKFDTP